MSATSGPTDSGVTTASVAQPDNARSDRAGPNGSGTFGPLRVQTFRRIWTASLLSNFGQLILGVGAAWEMTRLSNEPSMVALVQTALMLPLFLVAVPAGAIADMFDRRKIAMAGLAFASASGAVLTVLSFMGYLNAWVLLTFCFLIGVGVAVYGPSWQASVSEQVGEADLPAAIHLGSLSVNLARSVGPALGGVIVLAAGAKAAFAINALAYLPLAVAYFIWRRRHVPSRLPPERIDRAIVSGLRYAIHSSPIRTALLRATVFGVASFAYIALGPLIARDVLHGSAATYGMNLGATGVGAVVGAIILGKLKRHFSGELLLRVFACAIGGGMLVLAFSHWLLLSTLAFFVIGMCNMQTVALLNVGVQLSSPRWVTARALSLFSSGLTGGIALGSWAWGNVAQHMGVPFALAASGGITVLTALLGLLWPLARQEDIDTAAGTLDNEPEVAMALSLRSGPVVVEVEYGVTPENARAFYEVAQRMQGVRHRNGGFNWSIARDIADPTVWTERYHCPTWGDYLRMRDRYTQSDIDALHAVDGFCMDGGSRRVRRWLERPFGSVRWKADSPDPQMSVGYIGP